MFNLYLEQILWEDSLFNQLLAENITFLRIPLSIKLLEKHLNLNKKIFFHKCSLEDIKKIIKMQNLKTKPISCFTIIQANDFLTSDLVGRNETDYVIKLKGVSLSDFVSDARSVTDKKGFYRLVPLKEFSSLGLKNKKEIINSYRKFINDFYIKNYEKIKDYFKFSDINKNKIFVLNKLLKKNKFNDNKFKYEFIKEIMDFWKNIINKYKIYNTFTEQDMEDYGEIFFNEHIVVNYEIIEILSFKKRSDPNLGYPFKNFRNAEDLIDYIDRG